VARKYAWEGFEPATFGSADQRYNDKNPEKCSKTSISEASETKCTPQLTPSSQKESEADISELSADLAEIIEAWPTLPEAIRSAIVAIIKNSKSE
jgi:hypothetical protein